MSVEFELRRLGLGGELVTLALSAKATLINAPYPNLNVWTQKSEGQQISLFMVFGASRKRQSCSFAVGLVSEGKHLRNGDDAVVAAVLEDYPNYTKIHKEKFTRHMSYAIIGTYLLSKLNGRLS